MTERKCYPCPHYVKGEPGLRRCTAGLFDERTPARLPKLNAQLEVLRPWACMGVDKKQRN